MRAFVRQDGKVTCRKVVDRGTTVAFGEVLTVVDHFRVGGRECTMTLDADGHADISFDLPRFTVK